MTFFKIFLFIGLILFSNNSIAQIDSALYNGRTKYVKKAGKKAFKNGDYFSAISYYKKYLEKKPDKIKVKYELAEAYRLSRYYEMAEKVYFEVFSEAPEDFPLCQFHLAKMQQMNGKYKEAKANFLAFKKAYKESDAAVYKKQMKYLIPSCDTALVLLDKPLKINQHHLDTSINKAHIDFAPLPLNDSLVLYASIRSDSIIYVNEDDSTSKEPVRKFYLAKQTSDSTWAFVKEYDDAPLNQETSHNGNGCFNLDSSKFYFSRAERDWKGNLIFNLYYVEKSEGYWGEAIKLPEPINIEDFHSTMPSIGWNSDKEVEVLYFVSNRPGGKGGKDIWYAEWNPKKKTWKNAKNCGSKLNTPLNEVTPKYILKDKTLYFSSDGWPGMGGLDVFSTRGEMKEWTTPKNFGYPLNTSVDELYYTPIPNKEEGFFVSNRVGSVALKNPTCCHDIYHYSYAGKLIFAIEGGIYERINRKGKSDSLGFLKNPKLELYAVSDSTEVLLETIAANEIGEYFFTLDRDESYVIKTKIEGFFSQDYKFSTIGKTRSDTLHKDFFVGSMAAGPIVVKNIYYEYDKADLTPDSKTNIDTTLLRILLNNPDIIVEIGSHTDSRGSDAYNRKLSQRRAETVVNYLTQKGISRKRLKAKGYGESEPVAPNDNPDGTDNVEGRAMNRRTEFKVVGKIEGVSEIIYENNKPTDSY